MRYVVPTVPNVCSYITLAKMNCQIATCSTTDTGLLQVHFHKTIRSEAQF